MICEIPIIKVDATDSTNVFAKQLLAESKQHSHFCVFTEKQLNGNGQMGAKWVSEPYKNLTFSIVFQRLNLALEDAFFLSILVSLSIKKVLKKYQLPQLLLKWPNDILSGRKKIGGILIENSIQKGAIVSSIIGVGLNINQLNFDALASASSFKKITGIHYSIEEVLSDLLNEFSFFPARIKVIDRNKLLKDYMNCMFRFQKASMFQRYSGETFVGIIKAVSSEGKLIVLLEDGVEEQFEVKQVKLLY